MEHHPFEFRSLLSHNGTVEGDLSTFDLTFLSSCYTKHNLSDLSCFGFKKNIK